MSTKTYSQKGFLLIDALVGLAIAAVLCTAFLSTIFHAQVASTVARDRFIASLAQLETYEVASAMANSDFSGFITELTSGPYDCYSNPCSFTNDGTTWSVIHSPTTVDGRFNVSFTVDTVNRNSDNDIVVTGGTLDSDTIAITINVVWTTRGESYTESITTYLHKIDL